jgi:signal transduction histidine kinase
MSLFIPRSLFGQTLLLLMVGLVVSHLIGAGIYYADREEAVRAVGALATAQRIANLARLIEKTRDQSRQSILAAVSDQTLQVSVSPQRPMMNEGADQEPAARAIGAYLAERLALGPANPPIVELLEPSEGPSLMGHGPMMHRPRAFGLKVATALSDGQWLLFVTALPRSQIIFSRQFIVSMLLMAAMLVAISIWATRRVTAPLAALAVAAQRLGRDINAPPIPETGTVETRQASRAFNDMQAKLRQLIDNRTRLLAAISHDLRTPLTLLRLRLEDITGVEDRERLLGAIAEMDGMIAATLQYARDEAATERPRITDLTALVQSAVDDMADAGLAAQMEPAQPILHECRPTAMRRAVTNLLDNAIKYGKKAQAAIRAESGSIKITVDDEGPGLPVEELPRVLEPFYRVDGSRSRDAGGIGLGLAIAQSIVQAHRGTLVLLNRPSGGLRATISLPI